MNPIPRPLALGLLLVTLVIGSAGAASAEAVINIAPIIERYETCVAENEPGDAYRCLATGEDFAWPAGGLDPRVTPVSVDGGVFLCANAPNMLVLSTTSPSTGDSIQLTLNSPSACSGVATGTPGKTTTMGINPHGDPRLGPTMIRFEDDLGQDSFHIGFCTMTPGNLAVATVADDGSEEFTLLNAPRDCSAGHP